MEKEILKTKTCDKCKETINENATRCPKCQADLRSWFAKHKIMTALIALFLIGTAMSELNKSLNTNSSSNLGTPTTTPTTQNKTTDMQVGDDGYIRLPSTNDKTQVICIGPTKDAAKQIGKALLAQDTVGLLEVPNIFCVGNGSRIKLIEKDFPYRKVRILEGVNDVDADKVGRSGYLPYEWVVKE